MTLALLAPAVALAQTLASQTHAGMSGRVAEPSTCTTHAGSGGTDRVVTCSGLLSKAVVRFDFTVPSTTKGVATQVNGGSLGGYGDVTKTVTRVNATHVRVAVHLKAVSRVDIANVAIEYYR
jgi:hypothetical protein